MSVEPNGIVTLTTDLGTVDGYVAALKGVVLSNHRNATLVDVTHHIPSRDVTEAAFQTAMVWSTFPHGTVHLLVVDAGTETSHRPVVAEVGGHYFVGPDNGVLTLLVANEPANALVVLDEPAFFRDAPAVFPGRDILAPVAGQLASGAVDLGQLGSAVDPGSLASLPWKASHDSPESVHAPVVSIDRFGNCRTLITRRQIPWDLSSVFVRCGDAFVRGIHRSYKDVPVGKTLALFGSHGGLEIAVRGGSASQSWEIQRGESVVVSTVDDPGS